MRYPFLLFVLLAFAFTAFAELNCSLAYTENVSVRVLDALGRPLSGAAVQIYYQMDYTFSRGYALTQKYYTDANGVTQRIWFKNDEVNPDQINCEYEVRAYYDNVQTKSLFTAGMHPQDYLTLGLDVYNLDLYVRDQASQPLVGADVYINNLTKTTDKNGHVFTPVGAGPAQVFVKYGDGKITDTFMVENDTQKTIGLKLYTFTLKVVDENGNPLPANVTVGTSEYTEQDGTLKVEKLATATPYVQVRHKNMARELDVDLSLQNKYTAVFDYSSPQIGQVKTVSVGAITKLVVPVTDPGQFASGIATKGVQIRYKLSEQDSWRSASVYLSGKDTYVAEIPSPGEDKIVRFLIDAQDNDGNTATLEGQYVYQKPAQPLQNQSSGNEVNPPSQSEGIPLLFVVAGFIILIVVIYAIYRFKFSGRE